MCWALRHLKIEATDEDSGENSQLTYSIVSVNQAGQGRFDIDADAGVIYTTQKVERHQTFLLVIQAEDRATPASTRRYDADRWLTHFVISASSKQALPAIDFIRQAFKEELYIVIFFAEKRKRFFL